MAVQNDCLVMQIDDIKIDGVLINIEQDSAYITNPTGWENEMVAAAQGEHGVKRNRVASTLKFKPMTDGNYAVDDYSSLKNREISFRDSITGKRGRVSKTTMLKHGDLGKSEMPEVEYGLSSKIQWL